MVDFKAMSAIHKAALEASEKEIQHEENTPSSATDERRRDFRNGFRAGVIYGKQVSRKPVKMKGK